MENITAFLNGINPIDFIIYYLMGSFGLFISIYSQFYKRKDVTSFIFYIKDYKKRLFLNIIIIPVGIIFSQNLLGIEIGLWGAFTAGLSTDVLLDRFLIKAK